MTERKLSRPMSVGDEYLAAILDELKGLRADMADGSDPVTSQNGPVELREPLAVGAVGQQVGPFTPAGPTATVASGGEEPIYVGPVSEEPPAPKRKSRTRR